MTVSHIHVEVSSGASEAGELDVNVLVIKPVDIDLLLGVETNLPGLANDEVAEVIMVLISQTIEAGAAVETVDVEHSTLPAGTVDLLMWVTAGSDAEHEERDSVVVSIGNRQVLARWEGRLPGLSTELSRRQKSSSVELFLLRCCGKIVFFSVKELDELRVVLTRLEFGRSALDVLAGLVDEIIEVGQSELRESISESLMGIFEGSEAGKANGTVPEARETGDGAVGEHRSDRRHGSGQLMKNHRPAADKSSLGGDSLLNEAKTTEAEREPELLSGCS